MNRSEVIPSLVLSGYALGRIAAQDAGNEAPAAQWRVLSLLDQSGPRRVGALAAAARPIAPRFADLDDDDWHALTRAAEILAARTSADRTGDIR